jgi:glycosyltransferase involved in cell wall biosynthesis
LLFLDFDGEKFSMPNGLSLVMPTRNESACITEIVNELARVLSELPLQTELIIADYSEDNTLELASAACKSRLQKMVPLRVGRPGRGLAIRMGVEAANLDLICLIDGDGNHDPKYLPKLLEAYKPGSIVSPTRFPPLGWSEEHTFFHYFGNRLMMLSVNFLFRSNISDITNGFYLMSKHTWDCLHPDSDNWSLDAQIICRALKKDVDIIEIPYYEPKRKGGKASLKLITAFWRIGGRVLLESITL